MTFTGPAVTCTRLVHNANISAEELFNEANAPRACMIAATLTSAIASLSFVEEFVDRDSELKNVSFTLTVKITDSRSVLHSASLDDNGTELHLYGSTERGRKRARITGPSYRPSSLDSNPDEDGICAERPRIPTIPRREAHGPSEIRVSAVRAEVSTELVTVLKTRSSAPEKVTNGVPRYLQPSEFETEEPFQISNHAAVQCFRFLVDGMGISGHFDPDEEITTPFLAQKLLGHPVKEVLKEESKKRREIMGPRGTAVNTHYYDILPFEVQRVKKMTVLLPVCKRSVQGSTDVTTETHQISLQGFKGPVRIRRLVAVAGLSVLLQTQGEGGSCEKILKLYSAEGVTRIGCKRASSGYRSRLHGLCSLENGCVKERGAIVELKSSTGDIVATAALYPELRRVGNHEVPMSHIAARMGKCVDETFKCSNFTTKKDGRAVLMSTSTNGEGGYLKNINEGEIFLWRKDTLQNVILLGEMNDIVAEARCARSIEIGAGMHTAGNSNCDVRKALIVFDVNVRESVDEDMYYPYVEWYEIRSLRRFRGMHFEGQATPETIREVKKKGFRILLWHEDKIRVKL